MTLLEFVSCNPTSAPYVFWEGSRGISSSAHLVCVTTPFPAWRRARCTDGAAEGATLCCLSAVPLTSTVVAARPSYCPRQSVCVCGRLCILSFCVSDTVVISLVLCWLPVEIQDRACIAADTCPHVISVKLVAQLQRSINSFITEFDWKNLNRFSVSTFKCISIWPSCVHRCIALLNFPSSNGDLVGHWFIFI